MRLFRAEQVREFDRIAIETHHIPGIVLMENAGRGAALCLQQKLPPPAQSRPIAIFAGPGNNGGDGYVIARHLLNIGYQVWTFLCVPSHSITGDALVHWTILQSMTDNIYPCLQQSDLEPWRERLAHSQAIVDALLGTGLRKDISGWFDTLLTELNSLSNPLKMAVDLPSGLDANTGLPRPLCFHADLTTTFAAAKVGLVMPSAVPFVGTLEVVDIGIPTSIAAQTPEIANLQEEQELRHHWPQHAYNSHKGSYGHLLVLAGSPGKVGAALLSSLAALRTGVGLCTLANEPSVVAAVEGRILEVMVQSLSPLDPPSDLVPRTLPTNESTNESKTEPTTESTIAHATLCLTQTLEVAVDKQAVVIGPGLGQSVARRQWLNQLLPRLQQPVLVDADGLNLLQNQLDILRQRTAPTVLTPHPGEMGRMLGLSSRDIQNQRLDVAQQLAVKYNATVVLKGARTIIASPTGAIWINTTGHPGLATAGSGDVLSGIIGALLARGMESTLAARLGVYLHGKAADQLLSTHGQSGLIATDIITQLPHTIASWET